MLGVASFYLSLEIFKKFQKITNLVDREKLQDIEIKFTEERPVMIEVQQSRSRTIFIGILRLGLVRLSWRHEGVAGHGSR